MGARRVIFPGSRWLVGDGRRLNIWDDRWLLRPHTFKPRTPKSAAWANLKVSDLIDHDSGCWRTELAHQIFPNCNAELILSIPLCSSWPSNKLIWHYHSQGYFTVCSAYHMLAFEYQASAGSVSMQDNFLWRATWRCSVPKHICLFGWRAAAGLFPPLMLLPDVFRVSP